jgi:hypothetical protein
MGTEKTIRDRHEYAAMQLEGLFSIRPPKSPAVYRQEYRDHPETAPELYCGQKVVMRTQVGRDVIGYLLCRIVSWENNESRWSYRTAIYVVPEETSTPKLDERIGVLTHAYVTKARRPSYYYWGGDNQIISFDPADMPKRMEEA